MLEIEYNRKVTNTHCKCTAYGIRYCTTKCFYWKCDKLNINEEFTPFNFISTVNTVSTDSYYFLITAPIHIIRSEVKKQVTIRTPITPSTDFVDKGGRVLLAVVYLHIQHFIVSTKSK